MLRKTLIATISLPILYASLAQPAFAYSVTQFGSCLNPQGAASQVNTGDNHGVVGYGTYSGTDSIYSLSNGNVMQCMCASNGNGYQTTWLNASNYSQNDIDTLKAEGWEYFPAVVASQQWGLSGGDYLAKSDTYACSETPTCTFTPTPTPSVTETPTPTPTGSVTPTPTNTPAPTATPTPAPASQSVATTLASTGNAVFIDAVVLTGAISLIIGMILKKLSK